VSEKSVVGLVAKLTLLGGAVVTGALLGTIAVALAYRERVSPGPWLDVLPPSSAQCAFPTAPGWLLVLGAVSGAALAVLSVRGAPVLIRHVLQGSTEA
jgi:hypothetical protein